MMTEMERNNAAAVVAVKEETDPEAVRRNFSVVLRDDGTVRRVIEKPRHVPNMLKGCGLYLFDMPIFDAIRRTPRTAMRDEYELTDSIQILIDYEFPVRVAAVVNWDVNITYTRDLIDCCLHELARLGKRSLVGRNCRLADGVEIIDSVLGDDVTVTKPTRLERCVVLSGTRLDDGADYRDTVITKQSRLRSSAGLFEEEPHDAM
jgi:dTDP-glucose pyrophosphorylase